MPLRRVLSGEPRQVYHNDLFELPLDEVVAVEVRDADKTANNRSDGRSERVLQMEKKNPCDLLVKVGKGWELVNHGFISLHVSRDNEAFGEHLRRRHPIVEELDQVVSGRTISVHVV